MTSPVVSLIRRIVPGRSEPEVRHHLPDGPTSRPPLLFVHGVMHGAWCWEEHWIPSAVDRGWPCHAVELHQQRRAEEDDEGDRRWTLGDMRSDIASAIDQLDEPPVIIGHSTGARLALAVLADGLARAGVLLAPIPSRGNYKFPLHVLRRHPSDLVRLAMLRPLPPRRDYLFSERLSDHDAATYIRRLDPAAVRTQLEFGLPRRIPEIDVPLLVLGAEDDRLIDPVDVVRTARRLGTRARMFRDMGHSMMLDAGWRAPLEVMLHWLDESSAAPTHLAREQHLPPTS